MPLQFTAAQDRVYWNKGDGTFENVSEKAGIIAPSGKGLGIVAADFEGSGKLNLFIANDGEANFYFINETANPTDPPKFSEQALLQGAAYNGQGAAEAGMGVAAGDCDADGLLDLFVTNFYGEQDTLYRQQPDHTFLDETAVAKLREPTLHTLGFGAQFIDPALRGTPDLIVTNGHIDRYDTNPGPYEMSPQYFSNNGDETFVELGADKLGPYFQGKYLGRGLARIDFNRDGKEDAIITHLDAPAALLANTTAKTGHYIAIRLVGVKSARDAIGATVVTAAGGRTQMRQLTAGDGYESSNERIIILGLGEAKQVDSLEVRWLSGDKQQFKDISGDAHYLCIEGSDELIKRGS
jgi:hypothetical protein